MLRIFTIWGVPVRIHWSFSFLLIPLLTILYLDRLGTTELLAFVWLVWLLFFFVFLHEMGHVMMAKLLKVHIRDVVLSPLGGLARMESLYDRPRKEMAIAFAGPITNLLVGLLLFVYLYFLAWSLPSFDPYEFSLSINTPAVLYFSLFVNMLLFVLNLIPAFPMDGGRILRALLSMIYGFKKATRLALTISKVMAIFFILVGIIEHYYILIVLAFVVYFMGIIEQRNFYRLLEEEEKKKAGPSFPPTNRPEEDLIT